MHEQEAVALLRRHNKWRRGADVDEMIDPRLLGIAIDTACEALARLVDATAYARRLAVIMHRDHYAHESPVFEPFDDLSGLLSQIDNMMTGWPPYYAAPVQPAAVAVPDGYTPVRTDELLWLLGENGEFECPQEQHFRGNPAPYFWRRRLRAAVLAYTTAPAAVAGVPDGVAERLRQQATTQNDGGGAEGWCRVNYGDLLALLAATPAPVAPSIGLDMAAAIDSADYVSPRLREALDIPPFLRRNPDDAPAGKCLCECGKSYVPAPVAQKVPDDCCMGAAPARFCRCANTDDRLRIGTSLTHAVLDLNRGWNEGLPKAEIAERLDLCRRFAIDMLAAAQAQGEGK